MYHKKNTSILSRCGIILLLSFVIGYLGLISAYFLPIEPIISNVKNSDNLFQKEGAYPQLITGELDSQLDNWTDSLMLLTAADDAANNHFKAALNNSYITYPTAETPVDSLHEFSLENPSYNHISYARYWHGYLVYLKPLLSAFTYQEIRYIFISLHFVLCAYLFFILKETNNAFLFFPFIITILYMNPIAMSLSMQFSACSLLSIIFSIILLKFTSYFAKHKQLYIFYFFIIGIITNYFDLLTFPLITLGIPLVVFISISNFSNKRKSVLIIVSSFYWGIGYAFMWIGKWILSSIILQENILSDALHQAEYRSSHATSSGNFSYLDMFIRFKNEFNNIILILLLIYIFYIAIRYLKMHEYREKLIQTFLPFVLIFIMPIIWYLVFANHSFWHNFFTYRTFAVFIFAFSTYISYQKRSYSSTKENVNE